MDQAGYEHLFKAAAGGLKRLSDMQRQLELNGLMTMAGKLDDEINFLKRILDEIHAAGGNYGG